MAVQQNTLVHRIVGLQRRRPDPYVVVKYNIFRRIVSGAADAFMTGGPDALADYAAAHPEGDHILESLISYTLFYPWPTLPATSGVSFPGHYQALSPPFDVEPDLGHWYPPSVTIEGAPSLPGVSALGAGALCTFRAGEYGTSQIQRLIDPGIRSRSVAGGTPPTLSDVPAPPSLGSVAAEWGSRTVSIELYEVLDESGGSTVDSFSLNFSGLSVDPGNGATYTAIQAAAVPREEGSVFHNPPFTGETVGLNSNHRCEVWVLCQRDVP